MVSAKDVQALNARIEKINTDRTKAKTQQEMLQRRLSSELKEYKEQFGVDLKADTLKKTKALISTEINNVMSKVQEEYDLKEKVVSAIEKGDYETAYTLLGIEIEKEDEVEEEVTTLEETTKTEDDLDIITVNEEEDFEDLDFGFDLDSDVSINDSESKKETSVFGDLEIVDDDETESAESVKSKSESKINGSSVADAFSDLEVVEDELPDLGDDFGFGDLKDAKFE